MPAPCFLHHHCLHPAFRLSPMQPSITSTQNHIADSTATDSARLLHRLPTDSVKLFPYPHNGHALTGNYLYINKLRKRTVLRRKTAFPASRNVPFGNSKQHVSQVWMPLSSNIRTHCKHLSPAMPAPPTGIKRKCLTDTIYPQPQSGTATKHNASRKSLNHPGN